MAVMSHCFYTCPCITFLRKTIPLWREWSSWSSKCDSSWNPTHLCARMHHVRCSTVRFIPTKVSSLKMPFSDRDSALAIVKSDDLLENKSTEDHAFNIPHTPCPEFSKFLYFLFAPTLIYRDSYPRSSSVRWKYVISNLAQFATTTVFAYYLFYRFCLPVFSHFNSEQVTVKIFVLSILNCTLPGALVLFCGKFRLCVINGSEMFGLQRSMVFCIVGSMHLRKCFALLIDSFIAFVGEFVLFFLGFPAEF